MNNGESEATDRAAVVTDAEGVPTFQDWAQLVSFAPRLYYRPQSLDELKSFLAGLGASSFPGNRVRVPGGLHSCSDIFVADSILDVSALPRTIEFNADNSVVTASANWRLHDFLAQLSQRGKALTATGGTDEQTLAGLISTNTAPATPRTTLYELLEWVEYVTIDESGGSSVEKRVLKDDPAFRAAVCSLGVTGVLTRVQFSLVDEPYFSTIQKVVRLDEVLSDVNKTSGEYDFWRVDWVPDDDRGLLWAAKRIPRDQADPEGDYPTDQAENVVKFLFTNWSKFTSGKSGPLLDGAMKVVYELLATFYNLNEVTATGPLRTMLPVDRRAPLHVAMAEWSFDPGDLDRVLTACRGYFKQKGWPNLPIEIELTKTDDYAMSPWNWPGLDYVVKLNFMYLTDVCDTPAKKDAISTHLHGLWDYLGQAGIRFKAHWGKINFMDYAFVREHYDLDTFKPHIRPAFVNDYLAERILPPS
jgi:hypothetical protein